MHQLKFIATVASVTFLSATTQAAMPTPQTLLLDKPTSIKNIGLDCMGVGSRDRERSLAKKYSVRLETVGGYGQYLANADITLKDRHDQPLFSVKCDAPWLMIKLDPGRYGASVVVPGAAPRNVWFAASANGLHNVYVRFPHKMAGQEHRMMRPTNDGETTQAVLSKPE